MSSSGEDIRRLLALYRDGRLAEDELLERIGAGAGAREPVAHEAEKSLTDVLDGYRAAEASGAATLDAWADRTDDAALAGGLRALAAREAAHAAVLERRLRDLGGRPQARVPEWMERYNASLLDASASDLDRLSAVITRFADIDAALAPLYEVADSIDEDPLTRELLRAIGDDERATLLWMHAAFAARKR